MTALQSVKDLQCAYTSLLQIVDFDAHLMKRVGQLPIARVQQVSEVYQRLRQVVSLPDRPLEWRQTEHKIQTNLSKLLEFLTCDELILGEGIVAQAKQLSRQIANLSLLCHIPNQQQIQVNSLNQLIDELIAEPEGAELLTSRLSDKGKKAKKDVPLLVKATIEFFRDLKPSPELQSAILYKRLLKDNTYFLPILYAFLLLNNKDPKTCVECFSSIPEDVHVSMLALKASLSAVPRKEAHLNIAGSFAKAAGHLLMSIETHLEGIRENVTIYAKPSVALISLLAKKYVESNAERALYIAFSLCCLDPKSYRPLVYELYLLIAQNARPEFKSCLFDHATVPLELRLAIADSLLRQSQTLLELQDQVLVGHLFEFIQLHALEKVQPLLFAVWNVALGEQATDWAVKLLALALQKMFSEQQQDKYVSDYINVLFIRLAHRRSEAMERVEQFLSLFKENKKLYELGLVSLAVAVIFEMGKSKIVDTPFHKIFSQIENPNSRKKVLQRIAIMLGSLRHYEESIALCHEIAEPLNRKDEVSELYFNLCLVISTVSMQQALNIADKIPQLKIRYHAKNVLRRFTEIERQRGLRREPLPSFGERPSLPATTQISAGT